MTMSHDWKFFEKFSILMGTGRNEIRICPVSGLSSGDELEELIIIMIIIVLIDNSLNIFRIIHG